MTQLSITEDNRFFVGVTGPRTGMTYYQHEAWVGYLEDLIHRRVYPTELNAGDCVGVDATCAATWRDVGMGYINGFIPGRTDKWRAWFPYDNEEYFDTYEARNKAIVRRSNEICGFPSSNPLARDDLVGVPGGTGQTLRMALRELERRQAFRVVLFWPDGKVECHHGLHEG